VSRSLLCVASPQYHGTKMKNQSIASHSAESEDGNTSGYARRKSLSLLRLIHWKHIRLAAYKREQKNHKTLSRSNKHENVVPLLIIGINHRLHLHRLLLRRTLRHRRHSHHRSTFYQMYFWRLSRRKVCREGQAASLGWVHIRLDRASFQRVCLTCSP